jgi:hypothetical protein
MQGVKQLKNGRPVAPGLPWAEAFSGAPPKDNRQSRARRDAVTGNNSVRNSMPAIARCSVQHFDDAPSREQQRLSHN